MDLGKVDLQEEMERRAEELYTPNWFSAELKTGVGGEGGKRGEGRDGQRSFTHPTGSLWSSRLGWVGRGREGRGGEGRAEKLYTPNWFSVELKTGVGGEGGRGRQRRGGEGREAVHIQLVLCGAQDRGG